MENYIWEVEGELLRSQRSEEKPYNYKLTLNDKIIETEHLYIRLKGKSIEDILSRIKIEEYRALTFSRIGYTEANKWLKDELTKIMK